MFKSMRLRHKMTLWYTALTFLTVAAFAVAVYGITSYVLQEMLEREARLTLQQIVAQIENEDGVLTLENEVPLSSGSMYDITEENGSELASSGEDTALFDRMPIVENGFQKVQRDSGEWLLLDSALVRVDHFTLRVRVAVSCALRNRVLATLLLVILTGVPLAAGVALLGGFVIAKRALNPIGRIIHSAGVISGGDYTERIPASPAKDELGELTDTLNSMLANVETAFTREKRFAADASHELRTPVAVLRAYTESLLSDTGITQEQRAALQTMLMECAGMQRIIGQLLTLTRGQEGRYPVLLENLNLKGICDAVVETLAEQLAVKDMTVTLTMRDDMMLQADQSLITELLLNLMENAVKYTNPHGHITLSATAVNGQVQLSVEDDGIGIPQDALAHIFERFYRVDAVRDRSGTGLGLSIVQWIVQAHQGSIRVESRENVGSRFTVLLPARQG